MSKKPEFQAWIVNPRKEQDDFWSGIGGGFAFQTKDGRRGIRVPSINLVLIEPREGDETPPADEEA